MTGPHRDAGGRRPRRWATDGTAAGRRPGGSLLRAVLPYLLVVAAAVAGVAGLAVRPATGAPTGTVDYVVLAGAAGLRWDDVDPARTPALWRAANEGSIGWLSVRSAKRPTCPVDGWLTLGAGNYAGWDRERVTGACPEPTVGIREPDGIGANIIQQPGVVRFNDAQPYGAVPGALAESVRCTVAVGPGAAVAAARPFGRVDRYEPELPAEPADLLSSCVLSIVDLGDVVGTGAARQRRVAAADAALARVHAARPPNSLLLVGGVADTDVTSRLHVAIADGPGWQGGWLTSSSTGRTGYVQLVDLAATTLSALGRVAPERRFTGKPATVVPGRPADLQAAVTGDADADRRAGAQRAVSVTFFLALATVQFLLFLLVVPLMVRARLHAGPTGPASPPRRLLTTVEVLLVAAALVVPAALLTDAFPWWRAGWPGPVFAAATVALAGAGAAAVRAAPRFDRTLWPMGVVAAAGVLIVGVDVLTGSELQLNGVAGYSSLEGDRYAGVGSVGLGVFVACLLIVAGWAAQNVRRAWRPLVVVAVGGAGVIVVGSPYLGADPAGAIAVTAGVCVAAAVSTGGWITFARFAWATMAGLVVTAGFAAMDLRRPEAEQGGLGRFLTALADGTAGPALNRVAADNARALLDSPLTVLAVVGGLMIAFAQFSPWGGLQRLFGLHPAVRAAAGGTTVATLLAGALGGVALQVAGAAAAVVVPLAALTALRVLDHAADRTRPPDPADPPDPPVDRPVKVPTADDVAAQADGDGARPGRDNPDARPLPAPRR